MLVVENNSVYEIDEECLKRRSVPEECEVHFYRRFSHTTSLTPTLGPNIHTHTKHTHTHSCST